MRRVGPSYAGIAGWQVSGGIAGNSFIPPPVGDAGERLIQSGYRNMLTKNIGTGESAIVVWVVGFPLQYVASLNILL
jgi:hypothetical protein